MTRVLWLTGVLVGCEPVQWPGDSGESDKPTSDADADTDADADADADADSDSDSDSDSDVDRDVAPVVTTAEVTCYRHAVGEEHDQWNARAEATDPQGDFTLLDMGSLRAFDSGGVEVASFTTAMDATTYVFTAAFIGEDHGMACSSAPSMEFGFVVHDEDGNRSEPYRVNGIDLGR